MNDLIVCKYSKYQKYLLDPLILPCSNNVCKTHVDELKEKGEKFFKCFACDDEHKIPKNGFILNNTVVKLIDIKLHLNENRKLLAELFIELKEEFDQFENILKGQDTFLFDFISNIRNKIDLKREWLIEEINKFSNDLLDKLKIYEEECKENLNKLINLNEEHKNNLSQISNFIHELKEELRLPSIELTRIDQLISTTNKSIHETKIKYLDYKSNLLLKKFVTFNEEESFVDQYLFGQLIFKNYEEFINLYNIYDFKSSILTQIQSSELIKLCEFDKNSQFNLLYQATKDGFSSDNFHEKCDGIPNTLTMIKVKGNTNVFGGYCSVTWDKQSGYKKDESAFIFSLINLDNLPLKINIKDSFNAIYCGCDYGPNFGEDITILNDSNSNQKSYSDLGDIYENDLYQRKTTEAKNYLAGSEYFSTEEIEVYQVI